MRRTLYWLSVFAGCALLLNACGNSAMPLAREGTLLRKIQDRGKLIVGVKYDQPTFGYLNPQTHTLEGFDIAMAHEVAAFILGDPNKIEFKQAVTKDRIPFLKDGTVDVVMATMTITEERLKEIDFSVVYYVAGQRLLVPKDSRIRSIADIDGRKVGATKSSTSAANLTRLTQADVVQFDNYAEAMDALTKKQLDAISTDDSTLYGLALLNPTLTVVGAQFSYEPYGAGVPQGQPELFDAINTVIKNMKKSGKWQTIWKTEVGDKVGIITLPDPPTDEWRR